MPAHTPEECDHMFEERINAGDLDGLVALYESDATFVPQEGDALHGTAAIRAALAGFVAMKPTLKMKITRVIPVGKDLAMIYNDWTMTAGGQNGSGKAIELMRRQADGTWRFALDAPFGRD
jgi:uncharacterized protein (TIGR02246 family)